jgi:hypothetical protein
MNLNKLLLHILNEQILTRDNDKTLVKTTATRPIADAVANRRKISFYYSGPNKPKKDSVKRGMRYMVEPVAIGINKKNKMVLRAWVDSDSGSTSKKGFNETNWRTFILSRMSKIEITDEIYGDDLATYKQNRPGYKENQDLSMKSVLTKVDWTKKPRIKKYKKPENVVRPGPKPAVSKPKVKPTEKPIEPEKVSPETEPLPQPTSIEKPTAPTTEPTPTEPTVEPTSEPNPNVSVAQKATQAPLPQPKPKQKPAKPEETQNPENGEDETLKESINKIKRLMLLLN